MVYDPYLVARTGGNALHSTLHCWAIVHIVCLISPLCQWARSCFLIARSRKSLCYREILYFIVAHYASDAVLCIVSYLPVIYPCHLLLSCCVIVKYRVP